MAATVLFVADMLDAVGAHLLMRALVPALCGALVTAAELRRPLRPTTQS